MLRGPPPLSLRPWPVTEPDTSLSSALTLVDQRAHLCSPSQYIARRAALRRAGLAFFAGCSSLSGASSSSESATEPDASLSPALVDALAALNALPSADSPLDSLGLSDALLLSEAGSLARGTDVGRERFSELLCGLPTTDRRKHSQGIGTLRLAAGS